MKNIIAIIIIASPSLTFAVGPGYTPPASPRTVNDIFYSFAYGNLKGLIPALIAVALVVFFSGIAKYAGAGDNEEKRQTGRAMMIYGLIVLFVMFAFWGFVNILTQSFFRTNASIPNYLPLQ